MADFSRFYRIVLAWCLSLSKNVVQQKFVSVYTNQEHFDSHPFLMISSSSLLRGGDLNPTGLDNSESFDLPFTTIAKRIASFVTDQSTAPQIEIDYVRQLQYTNEDSKAQYNSYDAPIYLGALTFTLGIILCVDLFLHFLDHQAHHNTFFRKVLNTFYKECRYISHPYSLQVLINQSCAIFC